VAVPVRTPRVNNNDDAVRLLRVMVAKGEKVEAGDIVAEVETDKASFTVEAEQPGFVLAVLREVNEMVPVGEVLLWLGSTADEPVPDSDSPAEHSGPSGPPTAKALLLLERYGLRASDVQASGPRLTARDVEEHVRVRDPRTAAGPAQAPRAVPDGAPAAQGMIQALTPDERAMLQTVLWQRHEAVPGYVEVEYDAAEWERVASDYQRRERLLLSPLLALMAHRLVLVARENKRLNSTIVADGRFAYDVVNLGFTVQSDSTLYLVVVQNAAALTCREFIDRLAALQRSALAHRLRPQETSGATIAFSSMARWNVTRHIPVLPPHTALIVAHAAASNGRAHLGATYDHRVLTGADAFEAVSALSRPEGVL
jgi:pyruvate/2-oxoglutarate dehydrogenase complex dihydrolipoamide acyltransferase (E2) component